MPRTCPTWCTCATPFLPSNIQPSHSQGFSQFPESVAGDCFGVQHFGQNWGWAQPGYAIIGWILQAMLGEFYDNQIDLRHVTDCYGKNCFTAILAIILGLNFVALGLTTWFWTRQRSRMLQSRHQPIRNQPRPEVDSRAVHRGRNPDYQTLSDDDTDLSENFS